MKPDEASEHDSYGRIHVFLFDVISQMDFRMRLMEWIESKKESENEWNVEKEWQGRRERKNQKKGDRESQKRRDRER